MDFDPATASEDTFDPSSAVEDTGPQLNPRVRVGLIRGANSNPDQYARAKQLSGKTGLPTDVVNRNLDKVERKTRQQVYEELLVTHPTLAKQMEVGGFPEVAYDDLENLSFMEKTWRTAKTGAAAVSQGVLGMSEGIFRTPEVVNRMGKSAANKKPSLFEGALNPVQSFLLPKAGEMFSAVAGPVADNLTTPIANKISDASDMLAQDPGTFGDSFARVSQKGQQADAAFGALLQGNAVPLIDIAADPEAWSAFIGQAVPSLATAYLSGGSLPFIAWLEGMSQASDASDLERRTGVKISDQDFTQAVVQAASINAVLEKAGLDEVLKVGDASGVFARLMSPLKAALAEGSTEALQEMNSNLSAMFTYDPQRDPTQGVLSSFMGGAGSGGGMNSVAQVAGAVADRIATEKKQADETINLGTAISEVTNSAAQSPVLVRDEATLRQYMQAVADDMDIVANEATSVYLPAQAIIDTGIVNELPTIEQDMRTALELGHDVAVPMGDLVVAMAKTGTLEQVVPSIRFSADGMTYAQAQVAAMPEVNRIMQAAQEISEKQADAAEYESKAQVVYDQVMTDLSTAARYSNDVNAVLADLVKRFYMVKADSLGVTPDSLYAQYPLRTVGQSTTTGQVLEQAAKVFKSFIREKSGSVDSWFNSNTREKLASDPRAGGDPRLANNANGANAAPTEASDGSIDQGGTEYNQDALGTFDPANLVITLKSGANLSTYLHELGHFFLEVQADMASQPNAPEQVQKDMNTLLEWFGVSDVTAWKSMTLDQQRPYHERFARGFEAWLFDGNAPSPEMQGVFQRFRAWLTSVYTSLEKFLGQYDVHLSEEVRNVMGRMIATDDQIAAAKERRALASQFAESKEENDQATQDAIDTMNKRSLADIKWLRRARSKAIREFQKDGQAKRDEARIEARREVLNEPVYQAWNYLTGKEWGKVTKREAQTSKGVDPSRDSLFTAMSKIGGINKDAAISEWGIDPEDTKNLSPVFGKPVFRRHGGLKIDHMGEILAELGYLSVDENGKYDMHDLEDAVMQEIHGTPHYSVAYDYSGKYEDTGITRDIVEQLPAGRLNLDVVKGMLGKRFEEVRPKIQRMLSSDGIHPDVVSDLFRYTDGIEVFTSGEDLVNKLIDAVSPSQAIEQRTNDIVLERYGDITSEKAAQEAADEALHNEAMLRSAATEMKAISQAQGSVTAMAKAAKDAAMKAIAAVKVKELRPAKYAATAMRQGRAAEDAIKAKDMQAAVQAKRGQLLNIAMTQAAYESQREQRKAMQEFSKLRRSDKTLSKSHDINMLDTARSILAAFGINEPASAGNPLAALQSLGKVKEYNPDLHAVLEPIAIAAMGNAKPWQELTVEEFNGLRDTVRQLMHQAKSERQIRVNGRAVDLKEAQAALVQQMENAGMTAKPAGKDKAVTDDERKRWTLSGMRAGLRRMEHWIDSQDLGNFSGPFREYLFNNVSESVTKYRTVKNDVVRKYVELLQKKEAEFNGVKIDAPEIGYAFKDKSELLGAMIHIGNYSNKQKLLVGRGWGQMVEIDGQRVLDSSTWDRMVKRLIEEGKLTKGDYDFLQATWDLMASLKADAQASHFYLYGYYFNEVTEDPIDTPWGQYRGGYAPAKADSELVQEAAIRQGVNEIEQDFNFMMPSTGNGFTKGRVNYNKPLVMDLRLVAQHIDQVLRFTYLQPAISDTLKLVKRGEFATAMHAYDPQVMQSLILPWLQRVANQSVTSPWTGRDGKALQKFFTALRRNTGMGIMTANLVNALQQLTGLSLSAVKVQPRYLRGALARYITAPNATASAIAEQSPWMKIRLEDQSFEMAAQMQKILEGDKATPMRDYIRQHAYFMQRAMQNMVDTITWSAAYDKAIAENMEAEQAVRFADSTVRETQGSLLPEDISRFESGNAFIQLFTQFYSYFNMQANVLGTEFANVARTMGVRKGAGKLLYIYTMGFMIPAVMADAIVRTFGWDWDDDDDDGYLDEFMAWFFGSQIRTSVAMFPGFGQVANAGFNRFNDKQYDDRLSTAPAVGTIESAAGAPATAYKAIFEDGSVKRAIKDTLTLISVVSGVPVAALGKPIGYVADYTEGKVEPDNPADFARGLISGKGREEERVQ